MNTSLVAASGNFLPIGNLEAYIHRVNQVPMLTEEEEQTLARRLFEQGDLEAAKRLVMAHLRFVVRVARGYAGYGLPQADLIQEGNIGLLKAVKRFNPNVGVRLVSFAIHWIKAEMHEYILANWRIVKVARTKAQRKLFFNLRRAQKKLKWFNDAEIHAVATDLKVPPEEVRRMEMRLMGAPDESLDGSPDSEENGAATSRHFSGQYLEDNRYNPAQVLEAEDAANKDEHNLRSAITQLNARDRDIIEQRWLTDKKSTLEVLAEKYAVSAERIRQLEKNAIQALKRLLSGNPQECVE